MAGEIISGERVLTQEQLFSRGARAATGLKNLNVREGDVVALLLRNDLALLEATIGATTIGAYAAPINFHSTAAEVEAILRDNEAKAVVAHADLLPILQDALPNGVPLLVVGTPPEIQQAYALAPADCRVPETVTDWEQWLQQHPPYHPALEPRHLNMIHTIMFSGGTTGRAKAIQRLPITPEQDEKLFEGIPYPAESHVLVTGPLYHNAPNLTCLAALRRGAMVVLQPRFEAEETLALMERYRISHMHLVPTMFIRLLRLPEDVRNRYDTSALELVLHGAAPCPQVVKRAMIDWWGPVFMEYYGGTETGVITLATSEEWLARPGTVGKLVEESRMIILDEEGNALPPGEPGEIFMRNATQPDFTYHGQDGLRREIERDGLVTCGDIGYLDDEGYLFLCDRKNDMVISGGVNIYPAEIESVLIGYPGVRDCAVFGIPDEEFGESLAALIQPEDGADLSGESIRAFLREKIAGYKVPKLIEFRSDLPREDSGKIFKRKLREPFWEGRERNI